MMRLSHLANELLLALIDLPSRDEIFDFGMAFSRQGCAVGI